MYKKLRK